MGPTDSSIVGDTLADVDGDGVLELWLVVHRSREPFVPRVYGRRVDGLLIGDVAYEAEMPADRFAVGFLDFDGDGLDDLMRTWEGNALLHRGQADLSLSDVAQDLPLPALREPSKTAFVDFDNDGDADLLTLSGDPRGTLEVWRNDAGVFSTVGTVSVANSPEASFEAHHLPGSSWVTVRIGDPASFLLLSVEDDIEVFRREAKPDETVSFVGGFIDDEGPGGVSVVRRSGISTAVRFRQVGAGLEEVDLGQISGPAVVGQVSGEPVLIARGADEQLALTPLTGEVSWTLTESQPPPTYDPWTTGGIGADGQVFFRACSLLNCVVAVGRVTECTQ